MQWLSLVTEDSGVQRLKADNRKPAITGNVDAVSPYPSTHAARIGDGTAGRQHQPDRERRQGERRNGSERRRKQVPVLLDTRARHDRRGIENRRRSNSDEAATPVPRTRVNLYA
jgi:hypothetical protein